MEIAIGLLFIRKEQFPYQSDFAITGLFAVSFN